MYGKLEARRKKRGHQAGAAHNRAKPFFFRQWERFGRRASLLQESQAVRKSAAAEIFRLHQIKSPAAAEKQGILGIRDGGNGSIGDFSRTCSPGDLYSGISKAVGINSLGILWMATVFLIDPGVDPVTLVSQNQRNGGNYKQQSKWPEIPGREKDRKGGQPHAQQDQNAPQNRAGRMGKDARCCNSANRRQ